MLSEIPHETEQPSPQSTGAFQIRMATEGGEEPRLGSTHPYLGGFVRSTNVCTVNSFVLV
jgi:hypothetical protein